MTLRQIFDAVSYRAGLSGSKKINMVEYVGHSRRKKRVCSGHGRVYNLRKIFRRLNGIYFDGGVRARVEWGRAVSKRVQRSREFGAYYYEDRLIRIHPVLDQAWVPLHVVESILHHEMCHQVCSERKIGDRTIAHTPEFRRKEKEYTFHAEANDWLDRHLKNLLRPRQGAERRFEKTKAARQLRLL